MKTIERFLERKSYPLAPILAILAVSLGRMLFEIGLYDLKLNFGGMTRTFLVTVTFYTVTFFLFSVLFCLVLKKKFENVANLVSVGLIFGIIPPIIDLIFPSVESWRYIYFRSFTWTLFAADQPISESVTLWLVIIGSGLVSFIVRRSIVRALLAVFGAYAIFQGCSVIFLLIKSKIFIQDIWINITWLSISFACYLGLRWRNLSRSLVRLSHALPHSILVFCGATWVGKDFGVGYEKAGLLLFAILILIIQNDYYDRSTDNDDTKVKNRDVVWSNYFFFVVILWLLRINALLALIMLLFYLVGNLYQHQSVRLKERFCLSYKAEGVAALLAFIAGATEKTGFPADVSLLIPGILVLGGGTLISVPKDWKDIDADREAGIPTYYVILTRKGRSEQTVHKWIVGIITFCLFIPPVSFLVMDGIKWSYLVVILTALLPGLVLLKIRKRKWAVGVVMWTLACYLLLLSVAISHFR